LLAEPLELALGLSTAEADGLAAAADGAADGGAAVAVGDGVAPPLLEQAAASRAMAATEARVNLRPIIGETSSCISRGRPHRPDTSIDGGLVLASSVRATPGRRARRA
jgi:hypothetical protein